MRRELESAAVRRTIAAGHAFPDDMVATIARGLAIIELTGRDSSGGTAIELIGPGSTVGIGRVVDVGRTPVEVVRALGPCEVDVVPVDALAVAAARDSSLALALARERSARSEQVAVLLQRRTECALDERVASVVCELVRVVGVEPVASGGVRLRVRIPRRLIGELAGATRESATRALGRLGDEGLVASDGQRLVVRQLDVLELRAGDVTRKM